jgi:teichoic acid transport system ATP-binding protein
MDRAWRLHRQTYSSGMSARVGFSVAVHMKPDISMIDEALSTGDAHFREKATAKMAELRESARAMFVVSHGLDSIKEMCKRPGPGARVR